MQSNRWLQTLIVLLVIIASLYLAGFLWSFVAQFSGILLLFFLAWLLAFVLRPSARWLTSTGVPYTASVAIVYVVLGLVFVIGGLLLIPVVTDQIAQLINNFNDYVNQVAGFVDGVQRTLISWGVRDVDINQFYTELAGQVQAIGMSILQNTFSVLQSIATVALQVILIFIFSFYFMKDGDRIFGGMLHLLPPSWQDEARLMASSIEKSFGAFVRGQLVFALVYAALTAIVMLFFRLDYVVIASAVAGLCMIIPLVGNFLAFVPPLLVTLVTRPGDWVWVLLWLFIAQSFMMNVIGPRIMSQAIGIHPLYVVGAMLVGGQIAGFWGALFGIPVAGAINLMGRPLMRRIRYQVPLYQPTSNPQLTTRAFTTGALNPGVVDEADRLRGARTSEVQEKGYGVPAPGLGVPSGVGEARFGAAPRQVPALDEDLDEELDAVPQRPVTLTGRLWHLAWVFVSRAYNWVGTRAQARLSRH